MYKNIEVGFGRNFAGLFVSLAIAANAYPNSRNTGCNCRLQFSVVLQENARNDRCTKSQFVFKFTHHPWSLYWEHLYQVSEFTKKKVSGWRWFSILRWYSLVHTSYLASIHFLGFLFVCLFTLSYNPSNVKCDIQANHLPLLFGPWLTIMCSLISNFPWIIIAKAN